MKINGTSGANVPAGAIGMDAGIGGQTDPMIKDLQQQIENLQKQMKELSSNREMSPEAKSKKRQDLQKQISDLEMQLRQRQIEVKREEAMKKRQENYSMDGMLGTKQQEKKSSKQDTGLSTGSMEAMISAEVSMKQADVHGSTAKKLEGKAGVLEAEIKQDRALGVGVPEGKEEALAETQAKANEATSAQMSALAQANETAKEAVEEERSQDKKGVGESERDQDKDAKKSVDGEKEFNASSENTFDTEELGVPFSRGYQPVDVKL